MAPDKDDMQIGEALIKKFNIILRILKIQDILYF